MQIIIDTNQPLPEVTSQLVQALTGTQQQHGWDGVVQALESVILQVTVSEWADKAPNSIGRLKRVHRAFAHNGEEPKKA
jgi:hypothetical protein